MSHRRWGRPSVELLEERRVLTTIAWPLPPAGSSEELGERIVDRFQGTLDDIAEQRDFISEQSAVDALAALAVDYWAELLGQEVSQELDRPIHTWMPMRFEPVEMFSQVVFSNLSLRATSDATNVRISGVDEADHAEMLGDGLYLVSNGQLAQIFDVSDPEDIRWVSDIEVGHNNQFIYNGGKLAVISASPFFRGPLLRESWAFPTDTSAKISTYDLSDPSEPQLLSTTHLDGNIHSAHLVDSTLVVGSNFTRRPPDLGVVPVEPGGGEDGEFRFETEQEYLSRVSDSLVEHFIGEVRWVDAAGNSLKRESAGDFSDINLAAVSHQFGVNATAFLTFDFESESLDLIDSESMVGADFAFAYVDADSVYAVDRDQGSSVYEFIHHDDGIEFTASGSVPGQILSTRSMDEFGGVLRVFTSAEDFFGEERSDLYMLESINGSLETVGQLVDIAEGQSQFGVTFDGEVAYVTTAEFSPAFVPIDPLHVIDLSDPTQPVELSELEIPGVVTSLRRVGNSHLVGIGFAASEIDGVFNRQITLFDVSDSADPEIVENWVGDNEASVWRLLGDWSTSEMNIRYVTESGLLTIDAAFAEVEVFRIDTSGIDPIQHVANVGTDNWVDLRTRSFVDDNYLVVSSAGTLKTVSLLDPDRTASQVALGDPRVPDNDWIYSDDLEVVVRPLDNDRFADNAAITSITEFSGVDNATVGSDGRSIVLTRDDNSYAEVTINYEITLADGRILQGTLATTIRPQKFAGTSDIEYADVSGSFALVAADDNGELVSSAGVGDEFWVTLTADWDGSDEAGVFAAYADIEFDTSLLEVAEIEHLNDFENGTGGEVAGEGVLNLGGFTGDLGGDVLGASEIARFRVKVLGEGEVRFEVTASEGVGSQFLVFGKSHPIDRARITGVPLVLDLSASDENDARATSVFEPTDIDQDGYTSAIDALYLTNEINRRVKYGGSGEASASRLAVQGQHEVSSAMLDRMDVSGDGFLSAIDVLHVVNYINASVSSRSAEGESFGELSNAAPLSDSELSALASSQATQWANELRKRR